MQRVLVVDQGSTATKGALIDERGSILIEREIPVPVHTDGDRVEHDPEALVESVLQALAACRGEDDPQVLALACQRSTCLVWERASGRALTPALSWQDRREAARVAAMSEAADEVAARTGLLLTPHYAAPKLAGLLASLPAAERRRAASGELVAGTLDAFLVHRLTGRPATEPTHAGRTLLYDLAADGWSPELCTLWGIPEAALPALGASRREWGAWEGLPLVAVLGDQQAALLGHGGWTRGTCAVHFGTGAFVLLGTGAAILRHPGLLAAVLAATPTERRFQLEGSINSAGSAVDWAVEASGETLEAWTERPLPEDGPLVLPALAGLAAPWWRAELSGVFAQGERLPVGGELLAAVLVALAQRVADIVEAMVEAGGRPARLRVSGKLTRLRGLVQRIADLTGLPVEVAAHEEAGLAGLARLALSQAMRLPPTAAQRIDPIWSDAIRARHRERWQGFLSDLLSLPSDAGAE